MGDATPVIGVFDSGVGGLSIWQALRREIPEAVLLYLADSRHFPYGERPPGDVATLARSAAAALAARGAHLLVAACNTIGATVLAELRAATGLPVVGTVPAVRPAAALTRTGQVAVLATPATAAGAGYRALLAAVPAHIQIWTRPCPGLAERVEAGDLSGPRTRALLEAALREPLAAGADVVVLGCTHHAFLRPALRGIAGDEVALIDGAEGVARQTRRLLQSIRPGPVSPRLPQTTMSRGLSTGDARTLATQADCLLGSASAELAPFETLHCTTEGDTR